MKRIPLWVEIPVWTVATILSLYVPLVLAKPERATPVPDKKGLPDLAGETNWGTLSQNGRDLAITGHAFWTAVGRIRADGKVEILWTETASGEPYPSLYEVLPGGGLCGRWGRSTSGVHISEDGKLAGDPLFQDTIKLVPEIPDVF